MLEIQRLRADKNEVIKGLNKRNIDATKTVNSILEKDSTWREQKSKLEAIASELNSYAKEIGEIMKVGNLVGAGEAKAKTTALKLNESELKLNVDLLAEEIQQLLYTLPNIPKEIVPLGKTPEENLTIEQYGTERTFDFEPMPHWDIAKKFDLIDFESGVKITGAGFPIYKGKGAKLQRALINFFLEEAEHAGYEEFIPPHVVNEASGYGTGQLPDKEGQMYHIGVDDLYLIPTAEVPLTNIYRDVLIPNEDFSIKICGYTPCFRREAGSYGAHVRGLNRLHQFDKVEIVRLEHPSNSDKALEEMIIHVKGLLEKLGLQYRILRLCGGDMGFTSAITYDFEVYSAAQKRWLEVSSVSNFETFQSNRLKLRFKAEDKKTYLAHTLNGSALALPRIVAALLENHQTPEGVEMPGCLHKFLTFKTI